ncbi:MAG TPA: hypothetical protein VFP65_30005 [Anaeromyxobacteraceae bacterium]|nr:hypothetical protein [Anaeromyxobacteraceae bacterium]
MGRVHLGELLRRDGLIGEDQLQSALGYQRRWGIRLGEALLRLRLVEEEALLRTVARQLGIPYVRIGKATVEPEVLAMLPARVIRRCRALPLELEAEAGRTHLLVAFARPDDLHAVDEVVFAAGLDVAPALAGEDDLAGAIARHLDGERVDEHGLRPLEHIDLPEAPLGPMRLVG